MSADCRHASVGVAFRVVAPKHRSMRKAACLWVKIQLTRVEFGRARTLDLSSLFDCKAGGPHGKLSGRVRCRDFEPIRARRERIERQRETSRNPHPGSFGWNRELRRRVLQFGLPSAAVQYARPYRDR
jgi:hypothetical protein